MVERFELEVLGGEWSYAKMSEAAAKFGGPQKFIDAMIEIGNDIGKSEGLSVGFEKGMLKGIKQGIEKGMEHGLFQGRIEGAIAGAIGTLALGGTIMYFTKKDKSKDKHKTIEANEAEKSTSEAREKFNEIFSEVDSALTDKDKEMIENRNTEFLVKVKELEDQGLNADEERAKFNSWMEEFMKSKGLGNK